MRGFIYLDVAEWKTSEKSWKNLAGPQTLLKQHVKNQQFFNS